MERDGWTCQSCGANGEGVTLNVHHAYYEAGRAPWDYGGETLVTWCEDCHSARHETAKAINLSLASMSKRQFAGAAEMTCDYDNLNLFELMGRQRELELPAISSAALYAIVYALTSELSEAWKTGLSAGIDCAKAGGGA
jgi:hypothetical protein